MGGNEYDAWRKAQDKANAATDAANKKALQEDADALKALMNRSLERAHQKTIS